MEYSATSFFNITKRLIEERFVLDMDSTTRHLNIVGDVVNLTPIYWITEEIVRSPFPCHLHVTDGVCPKADLSIKTPTNPDGDVDAKDVYSAFSEVAECV